ncbi:hypothetical protein TUM17561_38850 [Enterobacter cloacae]|nr:hypothetical protein TUM17561_38850 [Enterobacter cloacae]
MATGKLVTSWFAWEGFPLLQVVHGDVRLTYVYSDQDSNDPLVRIDGVDTPEIFWFHCQPNGMPERTSDSEVQVRWEGVNSAWGKQLREAETQVSRFSQNLHMQGQYQDCETGLHTICSGITIRTAGGLRKRGRYGWWGDKPLPVCAECAGVGGSCWFNRLQKRMP